jgi:hypothetical protein
VAVEGDPYRDISVVIDRVRWVMKAGVVVVDTTTPGKETRSPAGFSSSVRESTDGPFPSRSVAPAP